MKAKQELIENRDVGQETRGRAAAYVWPIRVYARTTNSLGQVRRIDCYMEGRGNAERALVRAVERRKDASTWYGVEIRGITPLGQRVSIIYGPESTEVQGEKQA